MGSLFSGSGGSSGSTSQSSTTNTGPSDPNYNALRTQIEGQIAPLAKAPFQPYDTSKMYAPFNATQTQAFGQVGSNQNSWQPYTGAASNAYGNAGMYNPAAAGAPWLGAAAATPSAFGAGAGYMNAAAQSWPGASSQYTNPYAEQALGAGNKLLTDNFIQNTLPGINSQFIASGGGASGNNPAYNNSMNWALTNFNQNLNKSNLDAMSSNYFNNANQFNQDQSRLMGVGSGMGQLASTSMGNYGNLATTAGSLANSSLTGGINLGNAYSGLGSNVSNLGLTNTNALLQTGNQQQQQAQLPLTEAYNQFQRAVQWPYQTTSWAGQAMAPWQIPTTSSSTASTNSGSTGSNSPSIFGSVLGGALGIGSLYTGLNNADMFDWLRGSGTGQQTPTPLAPGSGGTGYPSGGVTNKRGGFIRRAMGGPAFGPIVEPRGVPAGRRLRKGVFNNRFAAGGYAPVVRGYRPEIERDIQAAKKSPLRAMKRGGYYADGGDVDPSGDLMIGGTGHMVGTPIPEVMPPATFSPSGVWGAPFSQIFGESGSFNPLPVSPIDPRLQMMPSSPAGHGAAAMGAAAPAARFDFANMGGGEGPSTSTGPAAEATSESTDTGDNSDDGGSSTGDGGGDGGGGDGGGGGGAEKRGGFIRRGHFARGGPWARYADGGGVPYVLDFDEDPLKDLIPHMGKPELGGENSKPAPVMQAAAPHFAPPSGGGGGGGSSGGGSNPMDVIMKLAPLVAQAFLSRGGQPKRGFFAGGGETGSYDPMIDDSQFLKAQQPAQMPMRARGPYSDPARLATQPAGGGQYAGRLAYGALQKARLEELLNHIERQNFLPDTGHKSPDPMERLSTSMGDFGRTMLNNVSMGFADKGRAAYDNVVHGTPYAESLEAHRLRSKEREGNFSPDEQTALGVLGMAAPGLGLAKFPKILGAPAVDGMLGLGAASGATDPANSRMEWLRNVARSTATGGMFRRGGHFARVKHA